jgi:DNA-binding NarL/FixJ family response regulator
LNVLIAVGSPSILERLDSLLSEIPGVVVAGHAKDGEKAIALVRECEPAVVILDGSLPPEGGLCLLRKLKSINPTPVAIVIMSFPNLQYRTIFREAGAAFFFDTSRELDGLVEALGVLQAELA